MTLYDIIPKALEGGPVTAKDISKRFEERVRLRLDKLRARYSDPEGTCGAYREFTYRLSMSTEPALQAR
jgi:hypothetical protein